MFKGETKVDVNVAKENVAQDINRSTKKCKEVFGRKILYRIIKRTIDIIGAILGILILIPLTIGIAIAKFILKEKSTIYYTHNRIGKNGKIFKMYKLQSMQVGADGILEKYLAENEEAREEYRKILYSIIFGGSYAITDEIHQIWVPGRSGNIFDVGIDTLGVVTGVLIYITFRKILKKVRNRCNA